MMIQAPHRIAGWAIAALVAMAFSACKDKPDDPELSYDRTALATNVADNLVKPSYDRMILALDSLAQAADAFVAAPNAAGLSATQAMHRNAWEKWLGCSAFEFGPAAQRSLRQSVNTFPADKNQIDANIAAGTWDLDIATNIDARGFPGLDYLLNGSGADSSAILAAFDSAPDAASRRAYLQALIADLESNLSGTRNDWDGYRADFVAANGTDVGSSTSAMLNQFSYDLEILKNGRIGIPLGKTTMGQAVPQNVEALYGGYSVALALAHLRGMRDVFEGRSASGNNGYGFDDALVAMEASYNGQPLKTAILDQFDDAIAALSVVPDPLDETVVVNPAIVDAAYVQIQRIIVLVKTDMASNLGILITYTDNDGD